MPAISTMVYPLPAYVRVEVNWADIGWATGAAVYRVDCLTGQRMPLRPYVSFDGDFLDLSCGYAVFWDTEPQLDRCVYYCTQAQDSAGNLITQPAANLVTDTYTRVVVDGWGSTDNGLAYALEGGTNPGNYDVTGTKGTFTMDSVNVFRRAYVDAGSPTQDAQITATLPVVPATSPISLTLVTRRTDSNNLYRALLSISTAGVPSLSINKMVAGVGTTLVTGSVAGTHAAGDQWTIRMRAWGNQIKAKAWKSIDPEPAAWTVETTDGSLTTGTLAGPEARLEAGNTNGTITISWDNFTVIDPCAGPQTIELCSDDLVVGSSGDFRLGDPVRPCNDVTLLFTGPIGPDCVPTQGIFFGNMADETFAATTTVFTPINAEFPIAINRTRQPQASTLTVASETFADRDALRTLDEPGSPLLLRGPAQYGIADRYMSVAEVIESRPVSDHRVQPRVVALPHVTVARPSGPSQGVCGTRVEDLCDIYPSWNAVAAAGLTYTDLLRGKASNDTPIPDTVERTWATVNSTFANWTAVNASEPDWNNLRAGD